MFREHWGWFLDLNNTRPSGMGISAIQFSEILAYFSLMDIHAEPWEIEVIRLFDSMAIDSANKQQEKNKAQETKKK